jgi:hypothetical protein
MTEETNPSNETAEGSTQNDGVIASATGNQDALPKSNEPNVPASGEATTIVPKESLTGERREKVWQELHKLEAAVTRVYGHLHADVVELLATIRGHLTSPNN